MNISRHVLQRYIQLPESDRELRALLDDIGIEVKRVNQTETGDSVFGLELLANRGDHYCYAGIARAISGRTGADVCGPEWRTLETSDKGEVPVELASALCLGYSATLLIREPQGSTMLAAEQLAPLDAASIHSITAPIDATNLANLELGQPTHVFDADKIVGSIVVRQSVAGEMAWPLFAEESIELPAGTLVIADQEKVLAIAGVIGCEDSKATEDSTRIILESGTFDPVAVRKAGRALSIHTDSLARFERGADPSLLLIGAGRVVHLLEDCGWQVVGATTWVSNWEDPVRELSLSMQRINSFIGTELSIEDVSARLQRYGFAVAASEPELSVIVPPHRIWDVESDADIIEEILKSIGYNNTPIGLPSIERGALKSAAEQTRILAEEQLLAAGFYEVFTDGFYSRSLLERFDISAGHPLFEHVETLNSLDKGYSLLKNNTIFQAALAVARNRNDGLSAMKMYEWTRTFHPDSASANGVCSERNVLWLIACGEQRPGNWCYRYLPRDY